MLLFVRKLSFGQEPTKQVRKYEKMSQVKSIGVVLVSTQASSFAKKSISSCLIVVYSRIEYNNIVHIL